MHDEEAHLRAGPATPCGDVHQPQHPEPDGSPGVLLREHGDMPSITERCLHLRREGSGSGGYQKMAYLPDVLGASPAHLEALHGLASAGRVIKPTDGALGGENKNK